MVTDIVSRNDLPSPLRRLLNDLDVYCRGGVVVMGGAVRDMVFHQMAPDTAPLSPRDIDLALRLPADIATEIPDLRQDEFRPIDARTVPPMLHACMEPLLSCWRCTLGDFYSGPEGESRVVAHGLSVDLLGLRPVRNCRSGATYPDVFAYDPAATFHGVPLALSINMFALRPDGRLMGPREYLSDFVTRTARVAGPFSANPFAFAFLCRLVDYCQRFLLRFDVDSYRRLGHFLALLRDDPELCEWCCDMTMTHNLYRHLLNPLLASPVGAGEMLDTLNSRLAAYAPVGGAGVLGATEAGPRNIADTAR